MNIDFTDREKINIFDELCNLFFERNFGRTSKSDIEAFMFHYYFNRKVEKSKNDEGIINYNKCSDYVISKDLGITQKKVSNLKVMDRLLYQEDLDWMDDFKRLIKNATYDKTTQYISLHIPDPSLFLEVQNYVEERGGYIEKQLNKKLLRIKAAYFIDLVLQNEPDDINRKAIIKELKKQLNESDKGNSVFDQKNIVNSLLNHGNNIVQAISLLSTMISTGNILYESLNSIFNTIINA